MDTSLSLILLKKILILFIMVLMGFITVKKGRLKSSDSYILSRLSFDWIIPCSLIACFQVDYETEKMQAFLFACLVAFLSIILYILLTRLIQKPLKLNVAEQGTVIFANSAGVGAPVVSAVLGSEQLFFVSAHMGLQNIAIIIYLSIIMNKDAKINWRSVFLNRNIFCIAAGLFMFFTGFRLPDFISSAVSTVGNMLSPVSMFMIGMLMGGVDFKEVFRNRRTYLVSALRLLIYPMIFILTAKLSGAVDMFPYAKDVILVILICSAAPAAALVTQMAGLYCTGAVAQDASTLNVITTLFCIISMPLLVFLYQIVC